MNDPVYDIIVGNVPGTRNIDNPFPTTEDAATPDTSQEEPATLGSIPAVPQEVQAVETHGQKAKPPIVGGA